MNIGSSGLTAFNSDPRLPPNIQYYASTKWCRDPLCFISNCILYITYILIMIINDDADLAVDRTDSPYYWLGLVCVDLGVVSEIITSV